MSSTLFTDVTAVLMDGENTVLDHAFVAVADGKIAYVGTELPQGRFDTLIDGHNQVLMPGLVNAHTHIPMTAMRGYGDGNNLQDWLHKFIFPVEAKWDDRAIRAATALGLCEMIRSGTTAIEDMYMHTEAVAQEVAASGMNANLTCGGVFFGETFSQDACNDCRNQTALYEQWHGWGDGQILVDASIHGEYTSQPGLWEWMADFAKTHDTGLHVHVSETRAEHEACLDRWGMTPTAVLNKHGAFDTRAIAAHCVWTTPEDWAILAQKGVTAAHNPCSNLKLGSGIAPVVGMRRAGVNVALGTDGVSSNNTTDMFEDLKLAAMLQNGAEHDPQALSAADALRMATVNGAKALGRNSGRIAVGCDADLILVDFSQPNLIPRHDVISNLVYAAHGCDVVMNMCRGKVIYREGEFLTIDLARVKREMADYVLPLLFGKN